MLAILPVADNTMKKGAKRSLSESNIDADVFQDRAVLFGDPIIEVFHHLPPTSFVGQYAIHGVCRTWREKLKQNGSWRKKATPEGFIQSCSENELLTLLATGEAFRLFSFNNILEMLGQHPQITQAWLQQEGANLPLTEEELETINEPNYAVDTRNPLYLQNNYQLINEILSEPTKRLPTNAPSEHLVTFAIISPRIALYILEHWNDYEAQLTDDVLCKIGESHPLVAMKILEVPELYSILDASHYVHLCYFGQAQLIYKILHTPSLLNMCIEEDLMEICRIQKLIENLQKFAAQFVPHLDIDSDYKKLKPKGL